MARQCLFCANQAKTKEHLFADSILQILAPPLRPITAVFGNSSPVEIRGDIEIRCVCRGCNGGWMSDLETKVKPLLSAMIHDISITLSLDDQSAVALWSAKTAMVLQATINKHGKRFYTREECERLRSHSVIPSRSMIWLGRFSSTGLFSSGTNLWLNNNLGGETCDGQVATFAADHLIFQVLTIRIRNDDGKPMRTICREGPWDGSLLGIYPVNQVVTWPPHLSFNERVPLLFSALRDRWKIGTDIG